MSSYIEKNLEDVKDALRLAEQAAGREGKTTLIAAVKYADDAELQELLSRGIGDVGENRVQQLLAHLPVYEAYQPRIHFIGTLQKNKIKYIIDKVYAIHSVDTAELAAAIEKHAAAKNLTVRVFAEVNIAREEAKSGALPEELAALCRAITALPHLQLAGVMTMAPKCTRASDYRAYFAEVRSLAADIWRELELSGEPLLSMGMSESFAEAVAEGTDYVRVGRRFFTKEEQK
ncbi:MAG: YggS family pyridoxal phosphate-dependent enzyme [Clostridia bacterium]|nr:YggS family pyridoxal phosphate-dependent enzyme [Clostridia bacterium]